MLGVERPLAFAACACQGGLDTPLGLLTSGEGTCYCGVDRSFFLTVVACECCPPFTLVVVLVAHAARPFAFDTNQHFGSGVADNATAVPNACDLFCSDCGAFAIGASENSVFLDSGAA